jgi:hypothetical protein
VLADFDRKRLPQKKLYGRQDNGAGHRGDTFQKKYGRFFMVKKKILEIFGELKIPHFFVLKEGKGGGEEI